MTFTTPMKTARKINKSKNNHNKSLTQRILCLGLIFLVLLLRDVIERVNKLNVSVLVWLGQAARGSSLLSLEQLQCDVALVSLAIVATYLSGKK